MTGENVKPTCFVRMGCYCTPNHSRSLCTLSVMLCMIAFYIAPGSEATSCRAAIRTAKGVVSDIGERVAKKSPGLPELAKCSETHSERDVHRVIAKKYKLTLPIQMTELPKAPGMMYSGAIKVLSLKAWMQFIVDYNVWHMLCGLWKADAARERDILVEFWRRYRALKPHHAIWNLADQNKIDLSRCCPLMLHGDEGRGKKKTGFLVMSFYSYMGYGTRQANEVRTHRPYHQFRLNYGGNTYLHRLVTSVLPKMLKDECALRSILDHVANDACDMLLQGVKDSQGNVYTACVLQIVGDWQWLVKAGQLSRSYSNCQKRPWTASSIPKGICHRCRAGQRDVPWECYKADGFPLWWATQNAEDPFFGSPALNRIPYIPNERAAFYTFDLFHSFHLGVAKSLAAGCLAMASEYMWSGNIDGRMEQLSGLWITWCEENKEYAYLHTISQSILGWPDKGTYPNGQWSKGSLSTALCRFFEDWATQQEFEDDDLIILALDVCRTINRCLGKMYQCDVWLNRKDAEEVAHGGLRFLHGYRQLATNSFRANRALFPLMPKGHSMDHIFNDLRNDLRCSDVVFFLNPLNHSVQISEDWVGRASRVSRKCGGPQVIVRTLERLLQSCFAHWREHGFIKD